MTVLTRTQSHCIAGLPPLRGRLEGGEVLHGQEGAVVLAEADAEPRQFPRQERAALEEHGRTSMVASECVVKADPLANRANRLIGYRGAIRTSAARPREEEHEREWLRSMGFATV